MTLQGRVLAHLVAVGCALPCAPAIAAAQQPTARFQGPQWFRRSDRSFRLGLELRF